MLTAQHGACCCCDISVLSDRFQIIEKPLLPEAAAQLFTAVLQGLSVHGQYEAVKNPLIMRGLQHYELLVGF